MATVQTLINRSLRLLGVIGSGDSPTSDETSDCLTAINALLDSWRNERLMAYSLQEVTLTLTSGDSSYSIGSGADIDTTRPVRIEYAYIKSDGIDYPLKIVDAERFALISDKTTQTDIPELIYYNPTLSNGAVSLWPVPSEANTLYIGLVVPLTAFSDAGDTVTLPPGWEQAIAFNGAIMAGPEFGREVSATVLREAARSLAAIKRVNRPKMISYPEIGRLFGSRRSDIESGE